MKLKRLSQKGEVDYDYKHDILFFKASERDYEKSIELEDVVIDIDKAGFIVGIQIFEASKFLNVSKKELLTIPHWKFEAAIDEGVMKIKLVFQVEQRNKIVEKNPIIMQPISEPLPNSQLVCEV